MHQNVYNIFHQLDYKEDRIKQDSFINVQKMTKKVGQWGLNNTINEIKCRSAKQILNIS